MGITEACCANVPLGKAVTQATMGKVAAQSKGEKTDTCVMCNKKKNIPHSPCDDPETKRPVSGVRAWVRDKINIPRIHFNPIVLFMTKFITKFLLHLYQTSIVDTPKCLCACTWFKGTGHVEVEAHQASTVHWMSSKHCVLD